MSVFNKNKLKKEGSFGVELHICDPKITQDIMNNICEASKLQHLQWYPGDTFTLNYDINVFFPESGITIEDMLERCINTLEELGDYEYTVDVTNSRLADRFTKISNLWKQIETLLIEKKLIGK